MHKDFARIVEAARLKLEAWEVQAGESIALLASSETLPVLRDAYFTAAIALGAEPVLVLYNGRPNYSGLPDFVVSMLGDVDVVGDLPRVTWSYSESLADFAALRREREKLTGRRDEDGGEIPLHVFGGDEAEIATLIECPPDQEVVARAQRAQAMIDAAGEIRITSRLGTDLVMEAGHASVVRAVDGPGLVLPDRRDRQRPRDVRWRRAHVCPDGVDEDDLRTRRDESGGRSNSRHLHSHGPTE